MSSEVEGRCRGGAASGMERGIDVEGSFKGRFGELDCCNESDLP